MKPALTGSILSLLAAALLPDPSHALTPIPAHSWSRGFGSFNGQRATAVAADGAGHVYLAGQFENVIDLGGGILTSAGGDIFLARFDTLGVHQWSKRFGDAYDQRCTAAAVDGAGNVYIAGYFRGNVDFGGGNLVSGMDDDNIYLAKFSASGVHQWSKSFGDANTQYAWSVAVDGPGNAYLTGSFAGTVNFGGGNLTASGNDIFIAKFNASGVHQWSQRFGDASPQHAYALALDASGSSVYLTGDYQGTVNFGGGNLTSTGWDDIFLVKFDAGGVHQWSKGFGSAVDNDRCHSVAIDGAGRVYITGVFGGTINFGGGDLVGAGGGDIFLAKFGPNGVHDWSQRFGDAAVQSGVSVVPSLDKVFLTAQVAGTTNFGGSDLVSTSDYDAALAEFTWDGTHVWSQRFGATSVTGYFWVTPLGMAVDGTRGVYLCGRFAGSVNFGGADLTNPYDVGEEDAFVVRFGTRPREPVIQSIADVGNDQGRKVRVRFRQSALDRPESPAPVRYEVYRRNDLLSAAAASPAPATPRAQLEAAGWILAAEVPAHGVSTYAVDAATDADSTLAGTHYSAFFVRAATADFLTYYDSPVDSGYSVDNLAPTAPEYLALTDGILTWAAPDDADIDHFTVYGSATDCLCGARVIDRVVMPSLDVTSHPYAYYLVTATDRAGNEGQPAVLAAGGLSPPRVLSISSHPNPFNPSTTIRCDLPRRGHASLAIYDARGARVALLLDEERDAGAYSVPWNGRDARNQPVSSGVYFVLLRHDGETRSHKLLLVK